MTSGEVGIRLHPMLPALFGYVLENLKIARFLRDWR